MTETSTTTKLSAIELLGSLTGYEEDVIEEKFRRPIGDFINIDTEGRVIGLQAKAYRALLFIVGRRSGETEADAYKNAMAATVSEVSSRFYADETEADAEADSAEEEPETPLGDAGSPSA